VAYLLGVSGAVKGKRFELKSSRTTFGRMSSNEIAISDDAISSQHCYIAQRGDRFVVRDLNSTNGTLINGKLVKEEIEIKPKDILQIGGCEFLFDSEENQKNPSSVAITTQVVIDEKPPEIKPKTFSSYSPFGSKKKETKSLWMLLVGVAIAVIIVGLTVFLLKLFK
jgi:pSer/pThr/pTyr-binding forkhead associated (FHA) protein